MATEKDRSSPLRPFPRRAKKETSRPHLTFGSALLSAYETGRQRPSLKSLNKLLEVLGADFRDLQEALEIVAKRPSRAAEEGMRPLGIEEEQEEERQRRLGSAIADRGKHRRLAAEGG